jgi:uncharacterized membrane protein YgcG
VLFLVAPTERKARIEVGYGLEGALTDALSKVIIATAVAPRFKQNDFAGASTRASTPSSRSSPATPRNGSAGPRSATTRPAASIRSSPS